MTPATIGAGWILVAISLPVTGTCIIAAIRSGRADKAEQRRIHPSFGQRPERVAAQEAAAAPFAHTLSDGHEDYDLALAKHTADGLARLEMSMWADLLTDPRIEMRSVPMQRQPYDHRKDGI